jgi:hypothetical protein
MDAETQHHNPAIRAIHRPAGNSFSTKMKIIIDATIRGS